MAMSLRILEWPDFISPSFKKPEPSAMTIGVFDGVHRGHRELIRRVVEASPHPIAVTFRENPQKTLEPQNYLGDIFTLKQKLTAFENLGIEQVILIDFSENFSKMKGQDFINLLVDQVNLSFLVLGANFRCGHRLDLEASLIKSMNEARGIPTAIVPPIRDEKGLISSSRIRKAIAQGDLPLAAALLGRNLELDPAASAVSECTNEGENVVFEVPGRLIPLPGRYKARILASTQEWETDIVLGEGKVHIPFSKDVNFRGEIRIEFLSGPKVLKT
jgi:riboflavin kinase/FMN adenylyltransferase